MAGKGRPPRIREDYLSDAQQLLHLSRAVKGDEKRPAQWRNEVTQGLKDLAEKLIRAPALDTQLDLLNKGKDERE